MRHTRRKFLHSAASTAALAALPRRAWLSSADELQKGLAADPLRPQLHLLPAKNWMNDPNGPIYWQGRYHMFFQYNPNAPVWGDMHWAHATSEDMIHWRHLPIALAPTPGWDDADGCFTGSAVDDHGIATLLYTGVKRAPLERATLRDGHNNFREVQCLATSTDPQLRTWKKYKRPVIEPPNDPAITGFRDPFLWRQGSDWLLGVASGHAKQGGCVRLYRSKDLRGWEYLHELATGKWTEKELTNPVDSGEMWECPDFFPLGQKHVLLYSTAGQVIWESGELDPKELKFHPDKHGILDHGAYYAQKTQFDAHGNRILWGWIPEKRTDAELVAAGWAGCMALPRTLSLSPDGELKMSVVPQAQVLREKSLTSKHSAASSNGLQDVAIEGLRAEMAWMTPSTAFTLALEDATGPWWSVELKTAHSGASIVVNGAAFEIPTQRSNLHEFHLFLDASVAELIVNRRHGITSRIYRPPNGPVQIKLDKNSDLQRFEAWHLRPISPNRLTT